jgi:hypothetical protein
MQRTRRAVVIVAFAAAIGLGAACGSSRAHSAPLTISNPPTTNVSTASASSMPNPPATDTAAASDLSSIDTELQSLDSEVGSADSDLSAAS